MRCGALQRRSWMRQPPRLEDSTCHLVVAADRSLQSDEGRQRTTRTGERPASARRAIATWSRRVSRVENPEPSATTRSAPSVSIACSTHHRRAAAASEGRMNQEDRMASLVVPSRFGCEDVSIQGPGRQRRPIQKVRLVRPSLRREMRESRHDKEHAGPRCGIHRSSMRPRFP